MVTRSLSRFFTERERRKQIKRSAELARRQVKASEATRRLQQIRKLEAAEKQIKELKRTEFRRSRLGKTIKLGGRVGRRLLPPSKGAIRFAGRAGQAVITESRRKKKRKRPSNRQNDFIGGFDPNFRFI